MESTPPPNPVPHLDILEGAAAKQKLPAHPGAPEHGGSAETAAPNAETNARPALRVYFRCANQYVLALRHRDGSGYLARCPSCGKCMRFAVGADGTSRRFFELSCR